jgi:8-oxo-dGTP pyrophosphatase MutT (NUDIX family)
VADDWQIHSESTIYDSSFIRLVHADVTGPHGYHVPDHHVVRMRRAAGVVLLVEGRVLLMWRHRFITRRTGWEIPAGRVEDGEAPIEAAARECLEETGWRPGPLRPWLEWTPNNGISDAVFHCFTTDSASHVGDPVDAYEAERIEWLTLPEVRAALETGKIVDGFAVPTLWKLLAQ